jgi:hypothetical protein
MEDEQLGVNMQLKELKQERRIRRHRSAMRKGL